MTSSSLIEHDVEAPTFAEEYETKSYYNIFFSAARPTALNKKKTQKKSCYDIHFGGT